MSGGTRFGKYELIKSLARGGMGEIFLARQEGPGGFRKTVALKQVLPHLAEDKAFVQGFLAEAALSARMSHRNIVQLFDFGLDEETGSYFLTMEYVAGRPLDAVLARCVARKERMPLALIQDVALQLCEGMSYAHNLTDEAGSPLNLVHRDLNPANLLVSWSGDVKIIDFGIAKSELSQVKTEAGMIKGKFVYMSPEQSLAKKLDRRSDLFAAGITLYEMLTGENPFHKPNVVLTLEAIQRLDPPPPSEFDPALAPFDAICARALAKDRDHRYADGADMAEDLRHVAVPASPERLGAFASRLFRGEMEEEQRLLHDTGRARLATGPGARTSSPGARVAPPVRDGATLVPGALSPPAVRVTPPRPAAPSPATLFIGAEALQPSKRRRRRRLLLAGIGAGATMSALALFAYLLLDGNGRPDAKRARAEPVTVLGQRAVEPPVPPPVLPVAPQVPPPVVEPTPVVAQPPVVRQPQGTAGTADGKRNLPDSERISDAGRRADAGGRKGMGADSIHGGGSGEAEAPAPVLGVLVLRTRPELPIRVARQQVEPGKIALTARSGMLQLGDESSPLRAKAMYEIAGDRVLLRKLDTEPWSLVTAGAVNRRRTPVDELEITTKISHILLSGTAGDYQVNVWFEPP